MVPRLFGRRLLSTRGAGPASGERGRKPPLWLLGTATATFAVGAVLYYRCEDSAPYTGRKRLIAISQAQLRRQGAAELERIKKQWAVKETDVLPATHPSCRTIRRVGLRIAEAAGLSESERNSWTFTVIRSSMMNAMVLPGGHVCVFTGLFKVTPTEGSLAAVLAHEAAHVIANHAGEQMTRELGMVMIIQILSFLGWFGMDGMGSIGEFLRHFLVRLPHSRELEREADIIGLHLLARCCVYDPQEMPKVFSRLQAGEGEALMLSEYLGTHPLHASRIEQQKEMLPRIMQERSRCCS